MLGPCKVDCMVVVADVDEDNGEDGGGGAGAGDSCGGKEKAVGEWW